MQTRLNKIHKLLELNWYVEIEGDTITIPLPKGWITKGGNG